MARRALGTTLLLGLICGVGADLVRAGDSPAGMDAAAIGELMRRRPPTRELTEAIRQGRSPANLSLALTHAARELQGDECLNVAGHAVALGVMSRRAWSALSFLWTSDVGIEGSLRGITHPDLHAYVLELDVRRILSGRLEPRTEASPVRVQVGALGDHARWILMDPTPGTVFVLFASEGDLLFERSRRRVHGLTARNEHVWKATGREAETLELLRPLRLRDPAALLEAMRSEAETPRWLATARVVELCRDLGAPFDALWARGDLHKNTLDRARPGVTSALDTVAAQLAWDAQSRTLKRPAAQER
jgi:hypothetical protein